MTWVMDGRYRAPRPLRWFESKLDGGPQDWKQYTVALLVFNAVLFAFGFIVLSLQPLMPLNPLGRGMLAPSTIFNTVISFMTNTNLQHYSGDQHFSNFSQIFFILPNMFLSASVGLCALTAIIRALRGEQLVGNFFVDMWRVVVYMFVPIALVGHADALRERPTGNNARTSCDGYRRQRPAQAADAGRRACGGCDSDQDARHQRRRLLRHEWSASV